MFTFVIPAHNEQGNIATIIGQARAAGRPGDRVLVVDSGSTDGTAGAALRAGAEVLRASVGKGAAMTAALAVIDTEWVCLLDADVMSSEVNMPATLRDRALSGGADQVVGDLEYSDPTTILSATFTIYEPLAAEFFPEVGDLGTNSLTGFRAIRRAQIPASLPDDFGVESYLNISLAVAGAKTQVCHLGVFESRFRDKGGSMAREIGRTVLDLAVEHGRLDATQRPAWDRWLEVGVQALTPRAVGDGRLATLARLFAAVRRPMPPRRAYWDDSAGRSKADGSVRA